MRRIFDFFKKDNREPETPLTPFETIYIYSTLIEGESHIIKTGIKQACDGEDLYRVWIALPLMSKDDITYLPRQIKLPREQAIQAATIWGEAQTKHIEMCLEYLKTNID